MNISSQEGSKFKSLKIEKYYFLITILYMLVSLYSFTHLKIFEYIIMLVYLISLMLFTKFQIIYLLISFIPFFSMVSYNFLIITTLIVYLLKNYNNIVVSQKILVVISIITWEALHLFSKGTDFRQFITLAVILLLFGIVLFDKSFLHYHSKRNIGISFSISTILLSVLIILNILGSGNLEIFINNGARLGTLQYSDSILNVNPNTISLYAITSLSMLSVTDNKEIKPIVKNIFQFSLTFIGLITYSRTFIMTFYIIDFIKISTYINFKRLISYIFSFFYFY